MYETNITSIVQDDTGFLWFSTHSGIEKFDGYHFTSFKNNPDDINSIDNAFALTLCKDSEGKIWIGNKRGFDLIDFNTEIFTHFKPHPTEQETKTNNHVNSICEDNNGMLWIGTLDGLNTFDKSSGKFNFILHDSKNPESICSNIINSIFKDKEGSLWFGTAGGLDKYDFDSGKFIHYLSNNFNSAATDYFINTIYIDKSGIFWLGTNNGLVEFDTAKLTTVRYLHGKENIVTSICEDEYGNLWIGTSENGLYSFDRKILKFSHYIHDPEKRNSISSNMINSVYKERSGTIWIAMLDGGVNKINRVKQPFKKYSFEAVKKIIKGNNNKLWIGTVNDYYIFNPENEQNIPYSFGSDELIEVEKSGDLWIGTLSKGVYKRNTNGHITNYYTSPEEEITRRILSMWKEPDGTTWIGTAAGSVYKVNPNQTHLKKVVQNNGSIKDLHLDNFGMLWIASFEGGLVCYDTKKNVVVKKYFPDSQNPNNTKSQTFLEIHEDKTGTLWFATDEGLARYDRSKDLLIYYNMSDGLPADIVWSILEDDHNNLWLSTRKGISKFDIEKNTFQNYDVSYGIPENGLSNIYGCKTENGEMYFGYPGGIIRFHPDSIKINQFIPPIIITSVKKLDKPVPIENEIHFSYDENFLSFEFVALSYLSEERNQFAYKLEAIDTGWVYSGTRRFASYPNLPPGEYIFRVKGSNNDGVWNEAGTSIAIIISPPFWRTIWAYSFYAFIFIFSLYGIRRYEMNRLKLKDKIKLDEAVLQEKEETEKIKSRFFANISHEFRTPLTLILGPAEKINSNTSNDVVKDAGIIKRNAQRLLQLVNQLLDLSRLEAGKLKLEASKGNIVSFVKGITLSFESLSESKDITLKLLAERDHIELYFDKEKMVKILTNILSNAFKFTPEDGMITISIKVCHAKLTKGHPEPGSGSKLFSESQAVTKMLKQVQHDNREEFVEIKIKDTGIGIPQEDIPKLFDRFYQVDSSMTKEHEGTGIGLALTKELVELHHGSISVESKIGEWTEFTLNFPAGRDHLKDHEILEEKADVILSSVENEINFAKDLNTFSEKEDKQVTDLINSSLQDPKNDLEENSDKMIILIVEDNYDMREYIKDSLWSEYQVEEAINGEQGVRKAEKIIPDLIISDMMMPKMDGHELTRILKSNEKTCHIPIILLTAKSEQSDKIEGLKQGADDYLTKPYDAKELQIRIENLITIRKKLQQKYGNIQYAVKKMEKKQSNLDEEFMSRAIAVVEKHLSEEDFSIEEFAGELNMSRVQLHRKLKALIGKSAGQYIRSARLAKAKQFIEEQKGNISEISYSVGFSSPAYFTKCFKEEFGYLPSDLQSK
ncbi:MAG: hybrid sensor histidine kinase/response regulator [Ignavibacteriota bacterium]|nr:MAG: hybrid sensor histidine kinase/response regulator [Ignavibacteriota bacterium]